MTFGDLQLFPVADGLVYVRPVYVVSGAVTEFRFVIVSNDNDAVMERTLDAALARLFPGYSGQVGDRVEDPDEGADADDGQPDGDDSAAPDPDDEPGRSDDPAELVAEAETVYQEAQDLLREGDLGGYQERMVRVGELIAELSELLAEPAP